jgi:glycerol-3-phosphate dehydrogenase
MLARRWRALFLDARQAANMAPAVAALLQKKPGWTPTWGNFWNCASVTRWQIDF